MSTDDIMSALPEPTAALPIFRLAAQEGEKFLRIASASLAIKRHYDLYLWLRSKLQDFIPHDILISACGDFAAWQLKLDIVSPLPGVRTSELTHCRIDDFVEDLHARWVHGGRRPLLLRAADVRAPLGLTTCSLHSWLCAMDSILAHGVHDARDGYDSLYIALNRGSLTKGCPKERLQVLADLLIPQIDIAFRKVAALPPAASGRGTHVGSDRLDLTLREQEVLELICRGKTNCDIAVALDISPFTVKNHLQRIFRKIGVKNRTQAATKYSNTLRVAHGLSA